MISPEEIKNRIRRIEKDLSSEQPLGGPGEIRTQSLIEVDILKLRRLGYHALEKFQSATPEFSNMVAEIMQPGIEDLCWLEQQPPKISVADYLINNYLIVSRHNKQYPPALRDIFRPVVEFVD